MTDYSKIKRIILKFNKSKSTKKELLKHPNLLEEKAKQQNQPIKEYRKLITENYRNLIKEEKDPKSQISKARKIYRNPKYKEKEIKYKEKIKKKIKFRGGGGAPNTLLKGNLNYKGLLK
tara:strand:+ start:231 stop:587 length:357 start_codon:yes stop_codon:yes gene_type:complete